MSGKVAFLLLAVFALATTYVKSLAQPGDIDYCNPRYGNRTYRSGYEYSCYEVWAQPNKIYREHKQCACDICLCSTNGFCVDRPIQWCLGQGCNHGQFKHVPKCSGEGQVQCVNVPRDEEPGCPPVGQYPYWTPVPVGRDLEIEAESD